MESDDLRDVSLPHGLCIDGAWWRTASVRPLNGRDEASLQEQPRWLPAARTTWLLARCLAQLGPCDAVTPALIRALPVGDRQALLLHLRAATFGDALSCVVECRLPECGERMDLDLSISDLLLRPYEKVAEEYECVAGTEEGEYHVRFRLPNGEDQEAASDAVARSGVEGAARLILGRCVWEVTLPSGSLFEGDELPAAVARALSPVMAELDPQAELLLDFQCPACEAKMQILFDAADYLDRELSLHSRDLYCEAHALALYYHWSEADILAISTPRRRRYYDLLADALGRDLGP